jgi:hypothetical protein
MRVNVRALAAVFSIAGTAALGAQQSSPMTWPGGHHAAIVLSYDDALRSQLDNAVPALDAAGLKATFFLSGTFRQEDVDRWRATAKGGHELGNHSVFHPCAKGSFDMPVQYNNESYSVPTMLKEIGAMNNMLYAIDGRTEHTYATPCGQHVVGGEDYLPALRASGLVRYVREASDPGDGRLDPFDVPATFFPDTVTGEQLIAYVEKVRASGGLGVMGFHGAGGDYLIVSAEAHRQLLQYLHEHQADICAIEVTFGLIPPAAQTGTEVFQILGESALAEPDPNALIEFWLYDHPSISERVRFAEQYDPWSTNETKYVR